VSAARPGSFAQAHSAYCGDPEHCSGACDSPALAPLMLADVTPTAIAATATLRRMALVVMALMVLSSRVVVPFVVWSISSFQDPAPGRAVDEG
jgi:hypothetical protein